MATGPVGSFQAAPDRPRKVTAGDNTSPVLWTGSILPEPAVELPVVPAVHVAVPVEVEVPQVAGVGRGRPERGPEAVPVLPVHVAVTVAVPEESGEAVHALAAPVLVAVAIEFPADL